MAASYRGGRGLSSPMQKPLFAPMQKCTGSLDASTRSPSPSWMQPPPPPRPEALKRALNGKRGGHFRDFSGNWSVVNNSQPTCGALPRLHRGEGGGAISHAKVYGCLFIGQPCCRVCIYMCDYFLLLVVLPGGLMASVVSNWMLINIDLAFALFMKEI